MSRPISMSECGSTLHVLYSDGTIHRLDKATGKWSDTFQCPAKAQKAKEKAAWTPDDWQTRLAAIFGHRAETPWPDKTVKAYWDVRAQGGINASLPDLALIERYYAAKAPDEFYRTALTTLLNHWLDECGKARKWAAKNPLPNERRQWWREAGYTQEQFQAMPTEEQIENEQLWRAV